MLSRWCTGSIHHFLANSSMVCRLPGAARTGDQGFLLRSFDGDGIGGISHRYGGGGLCSWCEFLANIIPRDQMPRVELGVGDGFVDQVTNNSYQVHDGRISALSQSFEDCGVRAGVEDDNPEFNDLDDFDEVVAKLTSMGLGADKASGDNKIEEIVRDFGNQMMLDDDDELKYEVYWHLAYMEGTKDGCYMQAQMEYRALTVDDPDRSEMLRRAVL